MFSISLISEMPDLEILNIKIGNKSNGSQYAKTYIMINKFHKKTIVKLEIGCSESNGIRLQ